MHDCRRVTPRAPTGTTFNSILQAAVVAALLSTTLVDGAVAQTSYSFGNVYGSTSYSSSSSASASSGASSGASSSASSSASSTANSSSSYGATAASSSSLQTLIQSLPRNLPNYMRYTYSSAMTSPLPASFTRPIPQVLPASQTYFNSFGQHGVLQTSGAVVTANNAFFQPLGTNGRTCFSCHQPASGMSMSVSALQSLFFATNGTDPVFAPVDGSNCPKNVPASQTAASPYGRRFGAGTQAAYSARSLLLTKGLFRVFLPVPKNADFTISVVSDPNGCNTDPAYAQVVDATTQEVTQMISVYRRPRMSANLKYITTPFLSNGGGFPNIDSVTGVPVVDPFTGAPIGGNIMSDGREPTLESQAVTATLGHAQAAVAPTAAQVAQMVAYENSVFTAQTFDYQAGSLTGPNVFGGPQRLSTSSPNFSVFALYDAWPTSAASVYAYSANAQASIARGQALFNNRSFSMSNAPGFNNASFAKIGNPNSNTCASCHGNMQAGSEVFPAGQRDIGVGGQASSVGGPAPSADLPIFRVTCKPGASTPFYGVSVLTNDPGKALISGKCADVGRRTTPQLRALSARAPYFVDGSAPTTLSVVQFYNQRFNINFTTTEMNDLANFLKAL